MQNFNKYDLTFDDLDARIKEILPEPLTVSEKLAIGKTILNCIDLTTLSGTDNCKKVEELSKQAISYKRDDLGIENTAAVCVYPVFAGTVSSVLSGSGVKTASVAGAFPSGQSPLEIRIKEVEYALENGAEEIDMVISRGRLLEGDEDFVFEEVSAIKEVCGNAHLKVILETGELKTVNLIRRASEIAILAGADFLKTSTGKIQPAATPGALLIMLDTIKEYYNKTGRKIGVKPAGGISEPDDAIKYYLLTQAVLGNEWMNNSLFRIGASRLADKMYDFIIDNSTF
jgi:deoxyribose-phosphate aldolase